MTVRILTCEHCDSEIDVAQDPRCVVYDPSGAKDVICEVCRELINERWRMMGEQCRIKRGWRA